MKSFQNIEKALGKKLISVLTTMGMPFSATPLRESRDGIIDPEAAILLAVSFANHSRVMTDLPAWISKHADLINHGKLKSLLSMFAEEQRHTVVDAMRGGLFEACPTAFKRAVGLGGQASSSKKRDLLSRASKIKPVDSISESCAMVKNRLLFGTGFRADLVSVVQVVPFPLRVSQLALLTGSAESTASRIVSDLQACGFLDKHNQVAEEDRTGQGLFVSTDSLRNASAFLEAKKLKAEQLRQDALDDMELRFDGLMRNTLA